MPAENVRLAVLASLPALPPTALELLTTAGGRGARRALAHRRDLPAHIQRQLVTDTDATTRRHAIAQVSDPDLLAELLDITDVPTVRSGLAANRLTPTDVLDGFVRNGPLDAPSSPAREALMNPATSAEAVRERALSVKISEMILGGSDATRSISATRILAAHPHLQDVWAAASSSVAVRAVARLPHLDLQVAEMIAARPGKRGKAALVMNPYLPDLGINLNRSARAVMGRALAGDDPATACADTPRQTALAAVGSPTLDLLIASSSVVSPHAFEALVTRRLPCVEPDVIVRVIENANSGADALRAAQTAAAKISITRASAASEASPLLALSVTSAKSQCEFPTASEWDSIRGLLEDNEASWSAFIRMLAASEASLLDVATVAAGVMAPGPR